MNYSKKKSFDRLIFFVPILMMFLTQCSLFKIQPIDPAPHKTLNEKKIQSLSKLVMKGNLIITSGENEGKLNATFDYIMPDTLVIQFRDVLGRKQALMSLAGENFELWMQRENRKLGREEIPDEFSLFVLKTLKLDQIRQLFLGLPLVSRDSSQAVTTFLGPSGLPERVEIFNAPGELSTLFIYSEFSLEKDIFLPSALQILDLNKGVDLKIKFYHFSMEYFNLSSHKKRGEIE